MGIRRGMVMDIDDGKVAVYLVQLLACLLVRSHRFDLRCCILLRRITGHRLDYDLLARSLGGGGFGFGLGTCIGGRIAACQQ
ncbi:hypothetical protein D3C84_958030 [compost metagenome]